MLKIAIAQINPTLGDIEGNINKILSVYNQGVKAGADLVVTSECSVTGYPLEDLVRKHEFLNRVREAVIHIAPKLDEEVGLIVGTPWTLLDDEKVYNAAVLLQKNKMPQFAFKYELPNYGVFDEKRVFTQADFDDIHPMTFKGFKLGTLICEDTWFPRVSTKLKSCGAQILISINGSPFEIHKQKVRYKTVASRVKETGLNCIYVNQVGGQDELVFDGSSFIMSQNINPEDNIFRYREPCVSTQMKRMDEDFACFTFKNESGILVHDNKSTFIDNWTVYEEDAKEITYNALVLGLRDYYKKSRIFNGVVLGLSGGVDSAIVATIAADALGSDKVLSVRLPSKYSSEDSLKDAADLADRMGIRCETIGIQGAVDALEMNENLQDIFINAGKTTTDTTEENIQARIRGNYLMSISNKLGLLLLSTGNKSEVSVGYSTLYGDMCGGFNPLKDIYKTFVFDLCKWRNDNIPSLSLCRKKDVIPTNIITKPPSAELRPDQKDEDSLPPYDVLDNILKGLVEYEWTMDIFRKKMFDEETVKSVMRMLNNSEYKRRQACPGTKITSKIFGRDRRYPIINWSNT
jgi:NAD+ synthase